MDSKNVPGISSRIPGTVPGTGPELANMVALQCIHVDICQELHQRQEAVNRSPTPLEYKETHRDRGGAPARGHREKGVVRR